MEYLWLAIYWATYFLLHSLLALIPVKNYFQSIGIRARIYRLMYNIIALITLIPIIIFSLTIDAEYILQPNYLLKTAGLLLAGYGIIVGRIAFRSYDTKAFLGLGSMEGEDEFRSDGLLRMVRHPLYSAVILIIAGYFIFNPKITSLISVFMIYLYLMIGIQLEEQKLIKAFGEKYLEYRKKTPMLIPRFWKRT